MTYFKKEQLQSLVGHLNAAIAHYQEGCKGLEAQLKLDPPINGTPIFSKAGLEMSIELLQDRIKSAEEIKGRLNR